MNALLPAVFGALTVLGIIGAGLALRPYTPAPKAPRVPSPLQRRLTGLSPRSRVALAVSLGVGVLPVSYTHLTLPTNYSV